MGGVVSISLNLIKYTVSIRAQKPTIIVARLFNSNCQSIKLFAPSACSSQVLHNTLIIQGINVYLKIIIF